MKFLLFLPPLLFLLYKSCQSAEMYGSKKGQCTYHCDSAWTSIRHERMRTGIDLVPQLAYVQFDNIMQNNETHANGIIIDRNMVLTLAEFCEVAKSSSFKVRAGQATFLPVLEEWKVVDYVIHPARGRDTYDKTGSLTGYYRSFNMNFCLLRLDHEFKWSSQLQMAALPMVNHTLEFAEQFLSAGWGWGQLKAGQELQYWTPHSYYQQLADRETCELANKGVTEKFSEDVSCMETAFLSGGKENCIPRDGDEGGVFMDPYSLITVGILMNQPLRPDLKVQPFGNLAYAVEWINEVRSQWVDVNAVEVPVNGTEAPVGTETPV